MKYAYHDEFARWLSHGVDYAVTMDFLRKLIELVFPARDSEEIVRSLSTDALAALVSPTLIETTTPATTALLPFRNASIRALIHEAKYRGNERAQAHLGSVLADYLAEIGTDTFGKVVCVPLPLSPARMHERGFNQCERIAARAASINGDGLFTIETALLSRVKNTEHQARLTRDERLTNVKGAFRAQACDPSVSYLILDDVITTGATMQAAIDALSMAGARHVIPLALSR